MRIAKAGRRIEPDIAQCLHHALLALRSRQLRMMHPQPLLDDVGDRHARRRASRRGPGTRSACGGGTAASRGTSARRSCCRGNTIGPSDEISRRIASPSVVLPEPDSPTMPSVSPWRTAMLTPSTALMWPTTRRITPRLIGNQTLRSLVSTTTGASGRERRRIGLRLGGQQRAGIGMLRRGEDLLDRSPLDDLALLHHADRVGELAHDAEIMGDEQHRHAETPLQFLQQARICACTVTSSAVVGSSAISRSGSLASAMAIITRWRWPPDSWCG